VKLAPLWRQIGKEALHRLVRSEYEKRNKQNPEYRDKQSMQERLFSNGDEIDPISGDGVRDWHHEQLRGVWPRFWYVGWCV
jgi:hypothetical protein